MKCLERNISQCILPFKRIFNLVWIGISWSSRSQMFFKIGVLKNCAIFTEKHLCWTLFLIKMQVCRPLLLTFWAYFFSKRTRDMIWLTTIIFSICSEYYNHFLFRSFLQHTNLFLWLFFVVTLNERLNALSFKVSST